MCMLCQVKGSGIDAAVAHVRRRRIQGCLIRQVMIAKFGRYWERGTLGHEAAGKASKQVKARSAPKPAPAIPAQHVFLLLLPVIHSRRVGEARQGNVRQCKARQGNKAVLVHDPATPAAPAPAAAAAVTSPAPGPTVLAQSAAFGTRAARGRRHDGQASGCLALPHAGQTNQALTLPRYRAMVWAWTACSRIIHCVNHALQSRLRELLAAGN